jgi:Zn-dependent peptidase ImmA (M78 family)/transcriptional regulator with XRE-family HTH domain
MASSIKVPVEPTLLIWGRETAGYSIEEAASKIGIKPEKLAAAEANEAQLTFTQLKNLSGAYKRPLAVFFLSEAPPVPELVHDFRLNPDFSHRPLSPRLNIEIRRAREHRDDALLLAQEIGERLPAFEPRAHINEGIEAVASRLRNLLQIATATQFSWPDTRTALKEWKRAVEAHTVLVFETSRIALEEMRGLSLPSETLPVIVLNGGDSLAGRVFTLLHEFTHLMLRQGGVCDLAQDDAATPDARVEAYCNAVAGAALVPATVLRARLPDGRPQDWTLEQLSEIADDFRVSKEVVLRRLLTMGLTTQRHYAHMREQFIREYAELRQRPKESKGGPEPAVMTVRNLGRPFVRLVLDAYAEDRISLSAVSSYLGVKLKHLPRIEDLVRRGEVAA